MKIKNILGASLLAASGILLMAAPSRAATVGDLIVGFEELSGTGTANNVMVDLGSYSSPVSSINLNSALTGAFGAGWATSGEIAWSIEGTSYTSGGSLSPEPTLTGTQTTGNTSYNNILWVTVPTTSGYIPPTNSNNTQNSPAGLINSEYNVSGLTGANSIVTVNPNTNGGDYSFELNGNNTANNTSQYGGYYSSNVEGTGPGSANLWQAIGGASLHADPSVTDLGTFTLSSGGVLTFTTVPEPSTYALLGLGGLGLLVFARRRMARSGLLG